MIVSNRLFKYWLQEKKKTRPQLTHQGRDAVCYQKSQISHFFYRLLFPRLMHTLKPLVPSTPDRNDSALQRIIKCLLAIVNAPKVFHAVYKILLLKGHWEDKTVLQVPSIHNALAGFYQQNLLISTVTIYYQGILTPFQLSARVAFWCLIWCLMQFYFLLFSESLDLLTNIQLHLLTTVCC